MNAWVSLGSNQGQPEAQLCLAIAHLNGVEGIQVVRCSGFYRTAPWGKLDQEAFVNAVVELETGMEPNLLLDTLLNIEDLMGRERSTERWGPRCIDLDLLTFGEMQLESDRLVLPHPRMHLRGFVLEPLLELDDSFHIPGIGPAKDQLAILPDQEVHWLGLAEDYCNRININD